MMTNKTSKLLGWCYGSGYRSSLAAANGFTTEGIEEAGKTSITVSDQLDIDNCIIVAQNLCCLDTVSSLSYPTISNGTVIAQYKTMADGQTGSGTGARSATCTTIAVGNKYTTIGNLCASSGYGHLVIAIY